MRKNQNPLSDAALLRLYVYLITTQSAVINLPKANLNAANFNESDLSNANLSNANLDNANLSGAKLFYRCHKEL